MQSLRSVVSALTLVLLSTSALAGTVRESESFQSQALGRNLAYSISLPNGYDTDERAYPVVYLLHGYGGTDTDWVRFGDVKFTANRLIAENSIPPMIIVMPDGQNSWYVNSEAFRDMETAMTRDLVGHIEATYRTILERSSRAIGGLSMGGYGAAHLAFKHPDLYVAVGVLSGALWRGVPGANDPAYDREGLFAGAFGEPFSERRWREANPFTLIREVAQREDPLLVFITVGDDDGFGFYTSSTAFYAALRNAEIPAQLRVTDGEHAWDVWAAALPEVLVFFTEVFAGYY